MRSSTKPQRGVGLPHHRFYRPFPPLSKRKTALAFRPRRRPGRSWLPGGIPASVSRRTSIPSTSASPTTTAACAPGVRLGRRVWLADDSRRASARFQRSAEARHRPSDVRSSLFGSFSSGAVFQEVGPVGHHEELEEPGAVWLDLQGPPVLLGLDHDVLDLVDDASCQRRLKRCRCPHRPARAFPGRQRAHFPLTSALPLKSRRKPLFPLEPDAANSRAREDLSALSPAARHSCNCTRERHLVHEDAGGRFGQTREGRRWYGNERCAEWQSKPLPSWYGGRASEFFGVFRFPFFYAPKYPKKLSRYPSTANDRQVNVRRAPTGADRQLEENGV